MSGKDIVESGGRAMLEMRLALLAALSALAPGGIGPAAKADVFTSRKATVQISSNRNDKN